MTSTTATPTPPPGAVPSPAPASPRRRVPIGPSVAAVGLVGVLCGGYLLIGPGRSPQLPPLSGLVEGTEVDLAFKVPGRLAAVRVREGEVVGVGQELARLTSEELLAKRQQAAASLQMAEARAAQARQGVTVTEASSEAQVDQARAGLLAAEAQLSAQRNGARPEELIQLEAKLRAARTAERAAKFTFDGIKALYAEGGAPRVKLDEVGAQYERALAERQAAEEQLRMGRRGARPEQIQASRAQVAQAAAAVAQARAGERQVALRALDVQAADAAVSQARGALAEIDATLGNARLTTPVAGVVKSVAADAGEMVTAGLTVLTVQDTRDRFAKFYVDEDRLRGLRVGDPTELAIPALKHGVAATVVAIAPSADFATRKATQSLSDRDVRAFQVKLKIEDATVLPGYTVEWALPTEAAR